MTLYEAPPDHLTIGGRGYPVETDFRVWIAFQDVLQSREGAEDKAGRLYDLMIGMGLPPSSEALNAMLEFYTAASTEHTGSGKSAKTVFDFRKDSEYIYSAFQRTYGIDLTTAQLHWWRFKALFKSLPDDCEFCKIMRYRAVDLKDVPKNQKQFYRDMKARYSLGDSGGGYRTEEEMKEYARRRFEEARERAAKAVE